MSTSNIIPGTGLTLMGQARNPAVEAGQDGSFLPVSLGRKGQQHVGELQGRFATATERGVVFSAAANDGTGRTILAAGGTTSGFMFYNPVGSGVNMEVLELIVAPLTATDVVGAIGLEYGAPPTTVSNAATVRSNFIGGAAQTALCKASYGSTIVAMTFLRWLPIFVQTTAGVLQGSSVLYRPDGSLIIAPGGGVNIFSTTTQSTNLWAQSVTWTEWKI
jgi:hypothetical protein